MSKNLGGRPSKQTPLAIKKLEEAFAMDCSIEEACVYADISKVTYYAWIKENEELSNRFEALRQIPFLKARTTILNSLDQPEHAKWYMERKKKKEFAQRTEQELSNPDGNLKTIIVNRGVPVSVKEIE